MTLRACRCLAIGLAAGLVAACADPVVPLGPDNQVTVTNQPGLFRLQAKDLNNVIADTSFIWVTADSQARIVHHSLITHGEMDLHVLDANGAEVYSHEVSVVYETDTLTNKGAPGSWTVRFEIKAATGKIDVTLETP
ncbi:MAG TPA: hypothetical protein VGU74_15575 [Gemmatimonadales bacterium]|nr:hypothetical protein [Gemmatimonadales bacterium]